jgi:hypothetical protein
MSAGAASAGAASSHRAPPDAPSSTCSRGTEGSNPGPSTGESAANLTPSIMLDADALTSCWASHLTRWSNPAAHMIQATSDAGYAVGLVFFLFRPPPPRWRSHRREAAPCQHARSVRAMAATIKSEPSAPLTLGAEAAAGVPLIVPYCGSC